MITGVVATALSFVPFSATKDIAIFIFDLTEFILGTVSKIATKLSEIKYCTIPIHKDTLICALLIGSVIALLGFIIFKIKKHKTIPVIVALLVIFSIFATNIIPVTSTRYANTVTVVSSGNNINIVVRSGLRYAYIINTNDEIPSDVYDYLPKATCETLDYLLIPYISRTALMKIPALEFNLKPQETHINRTINQIASTNNIPLPENTVTTFDGKYALSDKINIEIVDTYHIQYAIIKGNEKTMYVHLHGDTDFTKYIDSSTADIFVYKGTVPDKMPDADTVIISADSDIIKNSNLSRLKSSVPEVYVTAINGDIQLII